MYFSIALSNSRYTFSSYSSISTINFVALQLVREGSSSLLEVLKVAVVASLDIPLDVSIFVHFS
jgi:hypothetical protein